MNEIKLDREGITQADPQVMRDLQRVCTVCGSKRRCAHELAKNPSDPAWQKYCPNATTLWALAAEWAAGDWARTGLLANERQATSAMTSRRALNAKLAKSCASAVSRAIAR